jgi:hypothetical protein
MGSLGRRARSYLFFMFDGQPDEMIKFVLQVDVSAGGIIAAIPTPAKRF